ncbi:MAG: GNAT family N-acetyltransferase [Chloroflexota bacterium]
MSGDEVRVAGAPDIPGLAFRRPRLPDDYAELVAVFNDAARADGQSFRVDLARVQNWYEHASGWDPLLDEVLVQLDGRVVGFADVRHAPDSDGTQVYAVIGALHPDVRRRGIGTALLAHNEARARERARTEITDDVPVLLHAWSTDTAPGAIALLEGAGFEVARYFFDMVRPTLDEIPEMPMPAGLAVRRVEPVDHRAIFDADVEAFRDHWGGVDESDNAFGRFFSGPDFRPELWRVAWDGEQVAAVVMVAELSAYNEEHGARRILVDGVSVRRPWRQRGLARSLVADALRGAGELGFTSATLGVDAANPTGALGVYEAIGFAVERRSRAYRRPLERA